METHDTTVRLFPGPEADGLEQAQLSMLYSTVQCECTQKDRLSYG